jgi:hypothetical protein
MGEGMGPRAVKPGPPRAIEAIVSLLTPPACREHVVGDLHERYAGTAHYLAEAIWTIPMVIASRIRRTTDPRVLLMEAFAIYASFLLPAWSSGRFLREPMAYLWLALPVAGALATLVLIDAYAVPGKRGPLKPVLDAILGLLIGCVAQIMFWPLPATIMLFGAGMSILLVSALRMLFPPDESHPSGAG